MTFSEFRKQVESQSLEQLCQTLAHHNRLLNHLDMELNKCHDQKILAPLTRQFHQIGKQIILLMQIIHAIRMPGLPLPGTPNRGKPFPQNDLANTSEPSSQTTIPAFQESKISESEVQYTATKPEPQAPPPIDLSTFTPPNENLHQMLNRKERRLLEALERKEHDKKNRCI